MFQKRPDTIVVNWILAESVTYVFQCGVMECFFTFVELCNLFLMLKHCHIFFLNPKVLRVICLINAKQMYTEPTVSLIPAEAESLGDPCSIMSGRWLVSWYRDSMWFVACGPSCTSCHRLLADLVPKTFQLHLPLRARAWRWHSDPVIGGAPLTPWSEAKSPG